PTTETAATAAAVGPTTPSGRHPDPAHEEGLPIADHSASEASAARHLQVPHSPPPETGMRRATAVRAAPAATVAPPSSRQAHSTQRPPHSLLQPPVTPARKKACSPSHRPVARLDATRECVRAG